MSAKLKNPDHDQDTREKLLAAAKQIFSKKGFSGATVKEIAEAAECNISLISYHFDGKEGLFRTILEEFGRERLRDAEKILSPPENLEDMRAKLRLWMQQFLLCHVDEDNVCTIIHRENVLEYEFLWEVFQGTFLKTFEAVMKHFEAARKRGIVRKEVDPMAAASMLFGSLMQVGRNQKIQKKWMRISIAEEKYRTQVTEQFLSILLNGITGSSQ